MIKQTASIPAEDFDADAEKIKYFYKLFPARERKPAGFFQTSPCNNTQLETLIKIFTAGKIDLVQDILAFKPTSIKIST